MKTKFIKALAFVLCLSTLTLAACGDKTPEDTSGGAETTGTAETTDTQPAEGDKDMKNIKIGENTLDKFMIVSEESVSDAAAYLQTEFKRLMGTKVVLHINASQISSYSQMPYIRIISLPTNGISENIDSNQVRFYENDGNFKIVLGSRSISETAVAEYFVNDILKNNDDLTGYDKTVVIDGTSTVAQQTAAAKTAAETILNAQNGYSASNVTGEGKCYYVSYSQGSDGNDGLSPERPWKSIDKVSQTPIPAGSVVLFKRGDIWRFDSYAQANDAAYLLLQSNVTYSSYGEGAKPAIYGSPRDAAKVGSWSETEVRNVWKYSEAYRGMDDASNDDVGNIIFNGGEAYGYKMLKGDAEMTFEGNLSELNSNYQFWYNTADDHVYLYYDGGNPAEAFESIEMGVRLNMVRASGKSNVVFDNFTIKYGGAHGVTLALASNVTVTNCEIGWMGGGVYQYTPTGHTGRYGNGMEINRDCKDIFVENNYVYQIYDAGLSHQYDSRNSPTTKYTCYFENINYKSNVIENCFYGIEFFVGLSWYDSRAFVPENYVLTEQPKELTNTHPRYMDNIIIDGNYIMYSGYGWGYWRAASGQPGAAHIKAWENFGQSMVDENGDGKIIEITNNKMLVSRYDVIYGVYEDQNDMPNISGNTFVQSARGKTITLGIVEPTVEDGRHIIHKIEVKDRKYWNIDEVKQNKYLGENTYLLH